MSKETKYSYCLQYVSEDELLKRRNLWCSRRQYFWTYKTFLCCILNELSLKRLKGYSKKKSEHLFGLFHGSSLLWILMSTERKLGWYKKICSPRFYTCCLPIYSMVHVIYELWCRKPIDKYVKLLFALNYNDYMKQVVNFINYSTYKLKKEIKD